MAISRKITFKTRTVGKKTGSVEWRQLQPSKEDLIMIMVHSELMITLIIVTKVYEEGYEWGAYLRLKKNWFISCS